MLDKSLKLERKSLIIFKTCAHKQRGAGSVTKKPDQRSGFLEEERRTFQHHLT